MHDNEYLLQQLVAERLGEARADARRRAMPARSRRAQPAFAMAARIVENAEQERTSAPPRALAED
jgi:hypothetical protein